MIAVRGRLLDPALDPAERNIEGRSVRFGHERKQIPLCIRGIEGNAFKSFEEVLLWKTGIFVFSPLRFTAVQNARERLFGDITKLHTTTGLAAGCEHHWKIG